MLLTKGWIYVRSAESELQGFLDYGLVGFYLSVVAGQHCSLTKFRDFQFFLPHLKGRPSCSQAVFLHTNLQFRPE